MEKVGSGHHKFLKKMVCFMRYMLQVKILVWQPLKVLWAHLKIKLKKILFEVKLIDPFIFNDNNKWYLYHTRRLNDGNEIYVVELSDNLNKFNEQTLTKCLSADELWEDNDGMNPRSVKFKCC